MILLCISQYQQSNINAPGNLIQPVKLFFINVFLTISGAIFLYLNLYKWDFGKPFDTK